MRFHVAASSDKKKMLLQGKLNELNITLSRAVSVIIQLISFENKLKQDNNTNL